MISLQMLIILFILYGWPIDIVANLSSGSTVKCSIMILQYGLPQDTTV